MRRINTAATINLICTGIAVVLLATAGPAYARIDTNKPLDTSKGLYIRKSGTRVWKDPAPPRSKVYTYRSRNGTIVRHYTSPQAWARSHRKVVAKHRTARRHARTTRRHR